MRVKVELASRPRLLMSQAGDAVAGLRIVETTPGSPQAIVEVPDSWNAADVDRYLRDLERQGVLVDDGRGLWRPEHTDYVPLGFGSEFNPIETRSSTGVITFQNPAYVPGDTFGLLGCTEDVRRRGRFGAGVLVGVADTGVDGRHPWFAGKSVQGDLQDGHGHGTHVAGTIAGAQGIASDAAVLSKNVLPNGQGSESGVAAGIRALADAGCKVMNLSLGGSVSSVIDAACDYAKQRGCLVICAAGNSTNAAIGSPARVSDVIVMAYTRDRQWASFTDGRSWSNPNRLGAPGVDIVSAAPGGGTRSMSGTSMAAPHVVGAAALLMATGMDRQSTINYLLSHRGHNPDALAVKLEPNFGDVAPPPPEDDVNIEEARVRLEAIMAECDRDGLRYTVINGPRDDMTDAELVKQGHDNVAFAADIQRGLGIIHAHAAVGIDALKA